MAKSNPAVGTDAEIARAFPKGVTPPPLLFEFAHWYRDQPAGSVGGIELFCRFAEELMPPQADCNDDFALFINMPDGGAAGLWLKRGPDTEHAPFVLLDSEGGFALIAPNLACFLDRLSKQDFDEYSAQADFLLFDDDADHTAELAAWVKAHPVAGPMVQKTGRETYAKFDDGSGAAWLAQYIQDLEAAALADPDIRAISDILTDAGHRPDPGEFGYANTPFRVFAAGKTMIVKAGIALIVSKGVNDLGDVPEGLQSALRPHLFNLRAKHAGKRKGTGLWPSATVTIDNNGLIEINPSYEHAFAIGFDDFTPADFAADQRAKPRTPSKLPDWHKALIDEGGA